MKRSPKNDSRAIKAAVPKERRLSAGRVPARTGRFHRTDARRSGCSGGRALSIAGRPLRILIAPCALEPLSRWKTPNVQHRTSNAEVSEDSSCHSMFSVGCSMLDVPLSAWKASTNPESRSGTMNRRRTGARTALSASSLDLIRADMAVRAPIGGSWVGKGRGVAGLRLDRRCERRHIVGHEDFYRQRS